PEQVLDRRGAWVRKLSLASNVAARCEDQRSLSRQWCERTLAAALRRRGADLAWPLQQRVPPVHDRPGSRHPLALGVWVAAAVDQGSPAYSDGRNRCRNPGGVRGVSG